MSEATLTQIQTRMMFNDQKLITPIDRTTKEALRSAAASIEMPMAELVRLAITYATADRTTLIDVIKAARTIQTARQLNQEK